jgi:peptidoglycan/xylan/chitin deacetylase (PgdA/CDA1 family)
MLLRPGPLRRAAQIVAEAVLPESMVVWHGPSDRSRVALTFDDGPNELTPAYLDVLDRFDARATFFLVGEQCATHPDLVADIAARGHELAGHGYTHRPFPWLCGLDLLQDELERTAALLPTTTPRPIVRPPHGAVSMASLVATARAGFTTVLWSFDSGDWRTDQTNEVAGAFRNGSIHPGSIVLLHEGQAWTLRALPQILEQLLEAGHEPVTVRELLS